MNGDPIGQLGRMLILAGAILVLVGTSLLVVRHIPFLGNLPGDIRYRRQGFEFYFPLATCLVISLVITLILWIVVRLR